MHKRVSIRATKRNSSLELALCVDAGLAEFAQQKIETQQHSIQSKQRLSEIICISFLVAHCSLVFSGPNERQRLASETGAARRASLRRSRLFVAARHREQVHYTNTTHKHNTQSNKHKQTNHKESNKHSTLT